MARFLTIDVQGITEADRVRFASKFSHAPNGCWVWSAGVISSGYGRFKLHGRTYGAHRVSYALHTNADIPAGLVLDHLCRNPPCINPAHLEAVTYSENIARGTSPNASGIRNVIDTGRCSRGHDMAVTRVTRPSGFKSCAECDRQASAERRARLANDPSHRESERLRAINYRARKSA